MMLFAWLAAAYFIGCANAAYYAAKLTIGLDPRNFGSGTLGATNAGRLFGKQGFAAVMIFDAGKMLLALKAASVLFPRDSLALSTTILCVIAGHIFPVQLGFRGGKGVSSFIGACLYIFNWQYLAFCSAVFLVCLALMRDYRKAGLITLGSILATYPLAFYFYRQSPSFTLWLGLTLSYALVLGSHLRPAPLVFKIADTEDEFLQISRLNYKTFVDEIPQHETNESGVLVDKFHEKNVYFICKKRNHVIGMVAVCDERPFSLDSKIRNLDALIPSDAGKLCEVRILSIEKKYRSTFVFRRLMLMLLEYAKENRLDTALISGTTRQLKLYKHMGFKPFHSLVGSGDALYQPMYAYKTTLEKNLCGK